MELIQQYQNLFKGKPAVVVAAGPSLNKQIKWLKKVENKVLIVACDTGLGILLKHQIVPHIVTALERDLVCSTLFENIPENAPEELLTELLSADGVRIERIVSFGQSSPDGFWYDQTENEWVLLLKGFATLRFEEGPPIDLLPGDHLQLPARCRHRVEKTDPNGRTVWLAIFYR